MAEAADRILKILLQLSSDVTGATQTTAALKEVQAQAAQTGTAVNDVSAASSLAAGVGKLIGGGFVAAGVAAFAVYNHISNAVEAEKQLNEEIAGQNEQLDHVVTQMSRVADSAKDLSSQIKIGEKMEGELRQLSDKMQEFRLRALNDTSTYAEALESITRKALTGGSDFGLDLSRWISPLTMGQQQAAAELSATQQTIKIAVRDTNIELTRAAEETVKWNAATANLPKGIAAYQQELVQAQERLAVLEKARQADPDNKLTLELYQDQLRVVTELQNKIDTLTSTQARLAAQTQRVADQISRANFEQMDPAHQLASFQDNLLQIQEKLRDVGVLAASPNEALEKAGMLTGEDAKQTTALREEVIRLAGAWAQVLAMMGAVATQERAAQEALAKTAADAKLLRDEASGNTAAIAADKQAQAYDSRLKSLLAAKVPEEEAKKAAQDYAAAVRDAAQHQLDVKNAKTAEHAIQQDITAATREENALLSQIRFNQQAIEQNPFLSVDAKQAALLQSYTQEMETLNAAILKQRAFIAHTALDPAQLAQAKAELQKMTQDMTLLGLKTQALKMPLQTELANWVNSFGSTSHQIAQTIQGTIGASLQGVNNLLLSAGDKSKNWKQQLIGVEKQIAGTFLTMLENMALQEAAQLLHITTTTSAQTASGAAIAAAHAPAAAATAISSYGVAALVGEVLAIAAIAAITAALGGGLAGGGRVPGSPSTSDNLYLPMATGEHVINATATAWADRTFGSSFLDSINSMRVPVRGLADGGRVGGNFTTVSNYSTSQSQQGDTHVFVLMNEDELRRRVLASDAGRKIIIDHFRGRRLDLGIA